MNTLSTLIKEWKLTNDSKIKFEGPFKLIDILKQYYKDIIPYNLKDSYLYIKETDAVFLVTPIVCVKFNVSKNNYGTSDEIYGLIENDNEIETIRHVNDIYESYWLYYISLFDDKKSNPTKISLQITKTMNNIMNKLGQNDKGTLGIYVGLLFSSFESNSKLKRIIKDTYNLLPNFNTSQINASGDAFGNMIGRDAFYIFKYSQKNINNLITWLTVKL